MQVCDYPQGRYGNAIFRYLASSLFCILYNAERTYDETTYDVIFSDADFVEWSNKILEGEIASIDTSKKYLFRGYYQHDKIFLKYKDELIKHIYNHQNDILITDGYKPGGSGLYHYTVAQYDAIDLLIPKTPIPPYYAVLHLRLEDFVFVNQVLHPQCIVNVLENFRNKSVIFVVNAPTTSFEHRYIDYFRSRFSIICESNDPITDYHIMKNAKNLICSRSTMCWAAALFSSTLETVYFPDYNNPQHIHETFKSPIKNTIQYNIQFASEHEINVFFDNA